VLARSPRRGEFTWQIVDGEREMSVENTAQSFTTMEEAYGDGALALVRWRSELKRDSSYPA
jgi:hypothetical protein